MIKPNIYAKRKGFNEPKIHKRVRLKKQNQTFGFNEPRMHKMINP